MHLPPISKAIGALLGYLIVAWATYRAAGGLWSGVTVIGLGFVGYGIWYSTVRGARDWGDICVALAMTIAVGNGVALLWLESQQGNPALSFAAIVGRGHLIGVGLLGLGWFPLKAQGLLPGGPRRDQ